jgi:hypothetical protein
LRPQVLRAQLGQLQRGLDVVRTVPDNANEEAYPLGYALCTYDEVASPRVLVRLESARYLVNRVGTAVDADLLGATHLLGRIGLSHAAGATGAAVRPFVIGEDTTRVDAAARAFDAETYPGYANPDGLAEGSPELDQARLSDNTGITPEDLIQIMEAQPNPMAR